MSLHYTSHTKAYIACNIVEAIYSFTHATGIKALFDKCNIIIAVKGDYVE